MLRAFRGVISKGVHSSTLPATRRSWRRAPAWRDAVRGKPWPCRSLSSRRDAQKWPSRPGEGGGGGGGVGRSSVVSAAAAGAGAEDRDALLTAAAVAGISVGSLSLWSRRPSPNC